MVSGRLRKKYGIEGDAREELYACADTWLTALGDRHFLGGETLLRQSFACFTPTLAAVKMPTDINVLLCRHLARGTRRSQPVPGR